MKQIALVLLLVASSVAVSSAQQQPVVSNIQVSQRSGTKLVDISYNLGYSGGPVTVWVDVSSDGGRSYVVPAKTFSGHVGQGVSPGNNRAIVWNAEADFDGLLAEQMKVRINARAGTVPIPPAGMVLIPGGHFQMGEWVDGSSGGTKTVYTEAFFMDRYEVNETLWSEVWNWALAHGYISYNTPPVGSKPSHPVHSVGWFEAIKWCNARSEKEGLTPVYYTDLNHNNVYRGQNDGYAYPTTISNQTVKWAANGYRLPTEAEWEKAARGGLSGKAYPWGDTIDGTSANYIEKRGTTPVGFYNGNQNLPGFDTANGYGLYDMAGNVLEWCWDWNGDLLGGANPRGPATGADRVMRGGSWINDSIALRCGYRIADYTWYRTYGTDAKGFRCVKGL